jgi:antitoxin HicB
MTTKTKRNSGAYRFTVRPFSKEEGGGYLVEYPEIPGCMSDGDTLDVFRESGRKAAAPGIQAAQWRQRCPAPFT